MSGGESKSELTSPETKESLPFDGKSTSDALRDELIKIVAGIPLRRQTMSDAYKSTVVGQAQLAELMMLDRKRIMRKARRTLAKLFPSGEIERIANEILDENMSEDEKAGRIAAAKRKDKKQKRQLKKEEAVLAVSNKDIKALAKEIRKLKESQDRTTDILAERLDTIETKMDREAQSAERERDMLRMKRICASTDIRMIFERAKYPCSPLYWHRKFLSKLVMQETRKDVPSWLNFDGMVGYQIDLTYTWARSVLRAVFDGAWGPFELSMQAASVLTTGIPSSGMVANMTKAVKLLIRAVVEWVMSISIIAIQCLTIWGSFLLYDWFTGKSTAKKAWELIEQYLLFIADSMVDGFLLIGRLIAWAFGKEKEQKDQTLWEKGIKKNMNSSTRIFDIAKEVLKGGGGVFKAIKNVLKKQADVGAAIEKAESLSEVIGIVWAFVRDKAIVLGSGTAAVAKTAANVTATVAMAGGRAVNENVVQPVMLAGNVVIKVVQNSWLYDRTGTLLTGMWEGVYEYAWGGQLDILPPELFKRPYNMYTVCSVLNITQAEFETLDNKKLVKYVKRNPLCRMEVARAVYHASNELQNRRGISKSLKLRF